MRKKTLGILIYSALFGLSAGCSVPDKTPLAHGYGGTGKSVEYHANGKVRREANYVDGQLVDVTTYYASGTKASQETYRAGSIHSATYFFQSGRVRSEVVPN